MTRSSILLNQLGHPRGLTGRIILRMLNRVNINMNDQALTSLDLGGDDHVLEIGFGGGSLVARILKGDKTSRVTGAEISTLAIKNANKDFRNEHRANFTHYNGNTLPFENGKFTRAVCVNVIYFWSDVPAMLSEIHRVLADGGKLILGYSDQSPDKVTRFFNKDVKAQLLAAGFATVHSTEVLDIDNDVQFCTVAEKPSLAE